MPRGDEADVITGRDERGDVGLRKKAAGLASAIALIALVVGSLFGDRGILQLLRQRQRTEVLAQEIEELREENRARGLTVVLVTHLLSVLLNVATSVLLLEADRIVAGSTEVVLREETLSQLYGVPVTVTEVAGRRTLVVGEPRG